ncbi:glycoside hydrolase domain-containing protein [Nonomuraea bangladeshensis]|uniref:glycoside hydrolase domain-containing protein n=1 Tax=Nonomuraea bangladeshensis TaxID=404385 RepID=UPI003C2D7802
MTFAGLYLAPAPSHPDTSWMDAATVLQSTNWGVLPIYVGQQVIGAGSHVVTEAQGRLDGLNAAGLAADIRLAPQCVLYLDIENGGLMPADQVKYVKAWIREVHVNSNYWAGVYCSRSQTAQQVIDNVGDVVSDAGGHSVETWVYGPIDKGPSTIDLASEPSRDPVGSGFSAALVWQYRMSMNGPIDLKWADSQTGAQRQLGYVDLNCSSVSDPARPDGGPTWVT